MIEGLTIVENYISEREEEELLSKIKVSKVSIPKKERNSVARFGSRLPYNSMIKSKEIPVHFKPLCTKLVKDGFHPDLPDSVTVNEYKKGQGITYHYDSAKSGPIISVISLLGDATMGMARNGDEKFFEIPRRALVSMRGEARDKWKHTIFPVENDRLSIVFRKGTV